MYLRVHSGDTIKKIKEVISSGWLALGCWRGYDQKDTQAKTALAVMTIFWCFCSGQWLLGYYFSFNQLMV